MHTLTMFETDGLTKTFIGTTKVDISTLFVNTVVRWRGKLYLVNDLHLYDGDVKVTVKPVEPLNLPLHHIG